MELTPRLRLMNWLVRQGLTGLPENDLLRGFCERCRAAGMPLSRAIVFIDTLHPIFEGRGFRWNDGESNEPARSGGSRRSTTCSKTAMTRW
jgi:adenylate cyclase